jgi:hypothetical protein
MEAMTKMETTNPAELLDLRARLDQWRVTRKYLREPLPDDLRQAVIAISQKYPGMLLRRVLKIDPSRLNGSMVKKPADAANPKNSRPRFFQIAD